jgi:hypothetical protein
MGVPTKEELDTALTEAARMREAGEDPQYLAKALLNHHYRIDVLEKVLQAAELYLHSGHGAHEHTQLMRAIEKAKYVSANSADHDQLDYGL